MADWQAISQLAGGLTVSGVLVLIVWAFVTGKVPTKNELQQSRETNSQSKEAHQQAIALIKEAHQSEIRRLEASEQRAWEQAAEARVELKAHNQVLERMTDAVGHLRETVDTFTRGRGA